MPGRSIEIVLGRKRHIVANKLKIPERAVIYKRVRYA